MPKTINIEEEPGTLSSAAISRLEERVSQIESFANPSTSTNTFWNISARTVVQTLIGGIVAGGLLWAFALDNLLKLHQSSEIQRLEVEDRAYALESRLAQQETRQEILNAQSRDLTEQVTILENERDQVAVANAKLSEQLELLRAELQRARIQVADGEVSTAEGALQEFNTSLAQASRALEQTAEDLADASTRFSAEITVYHVAVIASVRVSDDLAFTVGKLARQLPEQEIIAFEAVPGSIWRAVTLGGLLESEELAEAKVIQARASGIPDAYTAIYNRRPQAISFD